MKRNTLFGGFSLLVAGAAIGAGAVASGSAMAEDDAPVVDEGTVEVITASADSEGEGDAFACTLEGVALDDVFSVSTPVDGEMVVTGSAVPVGAVEVGSGVISVGEGGVVEITEGSLPPGVELLPLDPANLPEGGTFTVSGAVPVGDITDFQVLDPAQVREGTEEECAGVREQFLQTTAP